MSSAETTGVAHPPASKLRVPNLTRGAVDRAAVSSLLDDALRCPLIVVAAPAGSGKTTAVAAWSGRTAAGRRTAWVTLEPSDNDPVRFWSCAVEAIRGVAGEIGGDTMAVITQQTSSDPERALAPLLADLAACGGQTVLVLDDFHVIEAPVVLEWLRWLYEHASDELRVVLTTRSQDPVPLGRLRVQGRVAEIGSADLAFTTGDATVLLRDLFEVDADPGVVAELRDRTEGWVAGLCVAALSLQRSSEPASVVAGFSGDHRHIVEYFIDDVLSALRDDLREFLLETSILSGLHPGLCDAVTGRTDSAALLAEAERAGLFVQALGLRTEEYRYHQLFREALAHEFARLRPVDTVAELHHRAGSWLRDDGRVEGAVEHFLAGGDQTAALDLVDAHAFEYLIAAQSATLFAWLAQIDDEALRSRPNTALARWAEAAIFRWDLDSGDAWMTAARNALGDIDTADPITAARVLEWASLHSILRGNAGEAVTTARLAREKLEEASTPTTVIQSRSIADNLARALFYAGEPAEARRVIDAAHLATPLGVTPLLDLSYMGNTALLLAFVGENDEALEVVERCLEVSEQLGATDLDRLIEAWFARAVARSNTGDDEAADREITAILESQRAGALNHLMIVAWGARVAAHLGDRERGTALLDAALAELESYEDPGMLAGVVADVAAELDVAVPTTVAAQRTLAEPLTDRELSVLRCFARDLSLAEIARELYVSVNTVKSHAQAIYRKLGVSSRAEARAVGRERGLL